VTNAAGKVVVITGASRGLGLGMAQAMAAQGVKLGLCSRTEPAVEGPAGQVHTASVDVTDEASVNAFAAAVAEALGPIDLWINNAGILEPIAFVRDLTADALRAHLEVNLVGVLHGTRAYLSHLRAAKHPGVLVNVSSGAALRGYAGWGAYCAGKAALDRLTECVQAEEDATPDGVDLRAYAVAPGVIDTGMQALIRSQSAEQFPDVQKFHDLKANDAFNTPEHVAAFMLDLAFDPAARPDAVVARIPPQA
jgi:NAD(P)-dependent dehydrogenase (short-subunit alcohol dehydrogenase family)